MDKKLKEVQKCHQQTKELITLLSCNTPDRHSFQKLNTRKKVVEEF